ncbi:hypothetical protein AGABI2DRAFT_119033 [Agaricus bisporus var. bisporus H97]|uniref:hypothetical protein n=1 Tax=Agaricus bisporus var. bisporus (strain H97 / ATCC MYA-4626 / FGSC 10389) TaxID=936046 RepID=UPI00029F6194|nr:hypothetical protein AGABI2DRAFT_119033 [Agaricus bisporus var. bisporus H97]EKV46853.1 hypothetical protein AGABI2DRAFT_119033 [Agaricus bisporus var. bisporus H97]
MPSSPSHSVSVRSENCCVLNAARHLPSEMLSIIFQHACPTHDISVENPILMLPFHLVLRLVSTSWYDVIQSTPQLWTSVFFSKLCAENADIKARYLKLCLDNSGSLPLTLSFLYDKGMREVGWFVSPIVDATLERSVHRIQALRLQRPPRIWLENLTPKMCQLATMHIDNNCMMDDTNWIPRRDESLFLPKSANIWEIYLLCPRLLHFRLESATASLTHVDLFQCPVHFAIEILIKCPNLIDFHCRCPVVPSEIEIPRSMLMSPITRNHLSTFSWSTNRAHYGIAEWDSALFELIRFPTLRRFNWWAGSSRLVLDDTILAFLSRFPKSITVLQLGEVDMVFTEEIRNRFLPLTGVTQLRLHRCEHFFMEEIFYTLSQGTDRSNILFPALTSLEIDYRMTGWRSPPWLVLGPESGQNLAQMLRTRIGLIDEFELTVEGAQLIQGWDEESWQAVRDVTRDGFDLTIIEDGLPVIII